jgi:hypothetical protein
MTARAATLLLAAGFAAAGIADARAQTAVGADEIRSTFVGKAACPPKPWGVSFGPYEFRADGHFFRQQDRASLTGYYSIADGKICIRFTDTVPVKFCLHVLKQDNQYFFRSDDPPLPEPPAQRPVFLVTPCPLRS